MISGVEQRVAPEASRYLLNHQINHAETRWGQLTVVNLRFIFNPGRQVGLY